LKSVDGTALEGTGVEPLTSVATFEADTVEALSEGWNSDH
jgi:hypothetical protein